MMKSPQPPRSSAPTVSPRDAAPRKRACDSCHKRKIHCDRAEPHCNWCLHQGIACTYTRPLRLRSRGAANRRRANGANIEVIQRLERLEELVNHATGDRLGSRLAEPKASTADTSPPLDHRSPSQAPSPDPALGAPFGKLHFAGHQLGNINSLQGIPLFSAHGRSWIRERTGTDPAFPSLATPLWQNQHHIEKNATLAPTASLELPPRKAVETYFLLFKTASLPLVFPFVHIETFQDTIDLAYSRPPLVPSSIEVLDAQACVLAFTCVLYFFEGCLEDTPVDGDLCAAQAQQLVPHIIIQPTVTSLQVVLMLGVYLTFSGNIQLAALHVSSACRIVYMLGAHVLTPTLSEGGSHSSYRAQIHLRRLFWFCYSLDKDISLRTGQPPCIVDDYCDVTLPDDYDKLFAARWGCFPISIDDLECFVLFGPGNLRLSVLKAKTSRLLYSAKALHKSDAEILRDVRELDEELENWRMSISKEDRPSLLPAAASQADTSVVPVHRRMHGIMMHFEYYYLMATIHRATSRCKTWLDHEEGDMDGVGSSLELTVQASRATLLYLQAAVHSLLGECFWMVLLYPMTAILTIFCNILSKPYDAQAQSDLVLLETAPAVLKQMRSRKLTPKEIAHMKLVEDFITELIRLGHCAVYKARRDR